MRIIFQEGRNKCTQEMCTKLRLLSLYSRRRFFRFIIIFKILNNLACPQQLLGIFTLKITQRNRELRDKTRLHLPKVKSKMGQTMFKACFPLGDVFRAKRLFPLSASHLLM